jgi:hypothetical protein
MLINSQRYVFAVATLFSVLLFVGCQDPNSATVHGVVSVGGKPVEYGTIRFVVEEGKGKGFGTAIRGGAYKTERGVPGKATVTVSAAGAQQEATTPEDFRGFSDPGRSPKARASS